MKKVEEQAMKAMEKVVRKVTKIVDCDWPPICPSWLHQPKRPEEKK